MKKVSKTTKARFYPPLQLVEVAPEASMREFKPFAHKKFVTKLTNLCLVPGSQQEKILELPKPIKILEQSSLLPEDTWCVSATPEDLIVEDVRSTGLHKHFDLSQEL